jgi:hypothetical protein
VVLRLARSTRVWFDELGGRRKKEGGRGGAKGRGRGTGTVERDKKEGGGKDKREGLVKKTTYLFQIFHLILGVSEIFGIFVPTRTKNVPRRGKVWTREKGREEVEKRRGM